MGSFIEHKYMYFTVKSSRVQSISQGLHFSMSYDGFGSGMKTFSPVSCYSLRDFGNLWSFIWVLLVRFTSTGFSTKHSTSFFRNQLHRLKLLFFFFPSLLLTSIIHFLSEDRNVCLSLRGGGGGGSIFSKSAKRYYYVYTILLLELEFCILPV